MHVGQTQRVDSGPVQIMPRMLGRYELIGPLARGGMATVYLARHRAEAGFERLFAIKVLHPHLADDEEFVNMMLDEARIAALLHHPNVVPILDLGSQDGIHYVVMEYIEGGALSALLRKYREERPPRLLVSILLDALAGLHAAHSLTDDAGVPLNLVHRDVSPQNVMVGVDGTARLTDFGIARAESRIMSTRPGQLKGKIAFMSPEQIRGADRIDGRSDVFSFAAMMWSALTGRRLFLADSDAATLSNILNLPVPPASTVGCKPPAELDEVIARGLARDPKARFQSAQEFEEALRDAATRASCLGTPREVGAWVVAGLGEELAQRRALKASMSHDGAFTAHSVRASGSYGSTPSSPSNPLVLTPGFTPAPGDAHANPVATALDAPDPGKRRRLGLIAGGVAAILIAVGAAAVLVGQSARADDAPLTQPVPSAAAAAGAPTQGPAPAPPPAVEEPIEPTPSAPTEQKALRGSPRRGAPAPWRGGPAPVASAAPAPAPPPAAPPPPEKKPVIWSKDSPLPPQ